MKPPRGIARRRFALILGVGFSLLACLAVFATTPVASPAPEPGASSSPAAAGFRLVALGTAQDGGYPQVACSCARCALARRDPKLARRVSSLAIHSKATGKVYLIDATPDLPAQIERIHAFRDHPEGRTDRNPVDGILLTHAHIGHYLGLAWLGFETLSSHEIPVWASPRMAAFLRGNGPWSQLVGQGNIALRTFEPGRDFELEPGLRVTALKVPHRDELSDTMGFLIRGPRRTLLYVP
ncbi:MAG TPA: MBL fold metallo-hydrolase, partial [Thermoanaerobaculia bacterium]|nr:MBL fold metallo-hydrolase [Thermoanaerobaculia bacterium]